MVYQSTLIFDGWNIIHHGFRLRFSLFPHLHEVLVLQVPKDPELPQGALARGFWVENHREMEVWNAGNIMEVWNVMREPQIIQSSWMTMT